MEKIKLEDLKGGALQEQFAKSFEKVVENLQNPNTPYKNVREITIKLKFVQNEKRDDVKVDIQVSEKLAPQAPMKPVSRSAPICAPVRSMPKNMAASCTDSCTWKMCRSLSLCRKPFLMTM